jgi:hypothetical protein
MQRNSQIESETHVLRVRAVCGRPLAEPTDSRAAQHRPDPMLKRLKMRERRDLSIPIFEQNTYSLFSSISLMFWTDHMHNRMVMKPAKDWV